ncbi:maleylpyruvate isomerase N-terminal domain-containing protein [Microbispora sp. H11081]|uniref:maleylpyruvate isomerase N-terminal domain-containing protein n=1 Tax=Microbispora sp. H11081 TaxID=2729107 RepID=UPI0014748A15|nr:maleylpyruvate isomerase N-terminal domain-containing protein [Microbispora sp. H11081]
MALSDHPAERHRQVAGLFTERVRGVRSWDASAPVDGWTARDVVRHLVEWLPGFLASSQFGARVEVPGDADAQTRLLGFIGRDPDWTGQRSVPRSRRRR